MVKKIFITLLLLLLFGGCNKESIPPSLIGTWLWKGSSGGIAGVTYRPKPSERIILNLSGDGKFTIFQNDTLAHSGTYLINKTKSIYSGKEELAIKTNEVKTSYHRILRYIVVVDGVVVTLSNAGLSIGDNRYDGFGSSFIRN